MDEEEAAEREMQPNLVRRCRFANGCARAAETGSFSRANCEFGISQPSDGTRLLRNQQQSAYGGAWMSGT